MQSALGPIIGPAKVHPENLDGRVAIVIGGANGIGFEITRALVHAGCKVIMVNRKQEQGDAALETLRGEVPNAQVDWRGCDMGTLAEVRDVFSGLREELERLDFVACSAGINAEQYGEVNDGLDRHFAVNYLGHFYAVNQLWPLLRKTSRKGDGPKPRVVFLSSEQHRAAPKVVHFGSKEEINDPSLGPLEVYGRAKLAMLMLAKYGLATKALAGTGDTVFSTAVHPGAVNTEMQQQWKRAYPGLFGQIVSATMLAIGRDIEQGSYSALYALTAPEIEEKNMNGQYFADVASPSKESSQGQDHLLGAALWDLSHRLVEEKVGRDAMVDWTAEP